MGRTIEVPTLSSMPVHEALDQFTLLKKIHQVTPFALDASNDNLEAALALCDDPLWLMGLAAGLQFVLQRASGEGPEVDDGGFGLGPLSPNAHRHASTLCVGAMEKVRIFEGAMHKQLRKLTSRFPVDSGSDKETS